MGSQSHTTGMGSTSSKENSQFSMNKIAAKIGFGKVPAHLKKTFGPIGQIIDTLMKLKQFDKDPYRGFLILLLALLKVAQTCQPLPGHVDGDVGDEPDRMDGDVPDHVNDDVEGAKEMFEQDRVYGLHATNIYLASLTFTKSQVATCMEVEEEDILCYWLKDDLDESCPNFVLLLGHKNSTVVLVIRGTLSVNDVITDALCEEEEFLGGFAHKGFIDGTKRLLDKCGDSLEQALADHPAYQLVICGHSMGGSVAMLTTLYLCRGDHHLSLPPHLSISCVALAPAPLYRVGSAANIDENIRVYVYGKDIVPSLSLASVAKLLVRLRAVDELGLSLEEQVRVVMEKDDAMTEINRERVREAVVEVEQDEFPYLHHVGLVMKLDKQGEAVNMMRLSMADIKSLAENIKISNTMLTDHMPLEYKDVFSKL